MTVLLEDCDIQIPITREDFVEVYDNETYYSLFLRMSNHQIEYRKIYNSLNCLNTYYHFYIDIDVMQDVPNYIDLNLTTDDGWIYTKLNCKFTDDEIALINKLVEEDALYDDTYHPDDE